MAGSGRHLRRRRWSPVYVAFRLGSWLAPRVPRAVAYPLADRLGDLTWLLNRCGRRAVRANLARVLGRRPPNDQVRAVFRHGARNYYDTLIIPTLTAAELRELVPVSGLAHLERALAEGRGAIVVGMHLSSVALAGQAVAASGFALTSIAERLEPPELNELLTRLRSGGGVRVVSLGPDSTRELLAALRRNEAAGLVMDRDIAGTGVEVRFFGRPASLPGGAALLALRTGAPILPAYVVRTADDRFTGVIEPPVALERGADLRDSIRRTTQRIAGRLEGPIAAHPEQWTVFQPLWTAHPAEAVP